MTGSKRYKSENQKFNEEFYKKEDIFEYFSKVLYCVSTELELRLMVILNENLINICNMSDCLSDRIKMLGLSGYCRSNFKD